jgi:tRNA-2-methylthio-N6-dimethylallyladenosine synthase
VNKKRNFYILTFGCQMNYYDSNIMSYLLEQNGHTQTNSIQEADTIIINSCSVREHAVNRMLARLESLKSYKKKNPELRIGVTGCVPQHLQKLLKKEKSYIDFLLGPDELNKITACSRGENGIFVGLSGKYEYSHLTPATGNYPESFISVMRGCDNFCSYCIVPLTRGRERSRKTKHIISEAKKLSQSGYKRVVLLGQNINDFQDKNNGLPYLLSEISKIEGIKRIGFLTSHPAHFPFSVIDVMQSEEKVEKYLHLPLQSGSTNILRRMKRGYTIEQYLDIIQRTKSKIGNIALSTDIIVGFPYETDEDFRKTIDIVKQIGFDSAYMFKYSPRKKTLANVYPDTIPEEVKKERLSELINVQSKITKEKSLSYKGKIYDVLVTGINEKNSLESKAITVYNKRVIVKDRLPAGSMVKVRIDSVKGWTPIGRPIDTIESERRKSEERGGKGER